jgi:hypothetical protein
MSACQSRVGGVCEREATWKQEVRVGDRPNGRMLYFSYWCDEHAARITKRREEQLARPPVLTRLEPSSST